MRRNLIGIVIFICVLFTACADVKGTDEYLTEMTCSEAVSEEPVLEAPVKDIYVHVCGAVEKPGVYKLNTGSRGYQAVEAAGGYSEDAATDSVNMAEVLTDGQMLHIPTVIEQEALQEEKLQQEMGLVNINTADERELMELPGIGEARAEQIVLYRQQNGAFAHPEDLKKIDGIKESVYEKLKDKITI